MTGLEFTDESAKQLEKVYLTRDIIAQRLETIWQLHLSGGERVLDIGCGPGYLCESMGEIVGRRGAVVGIDISTDLIALCNRRKPSTKSPIHRYTPSFPSKIKCCVDRLRPPPL